jgi:hypothetical protein
LSFFDDDDEPPRTERTAPRRTPPAGARRPPGRRTAEQQAIQQRRLIAVFAVIVVVFIFALVIKGCSDSATTASLKDYNQSVSQIIDNSDGTAASVFQLLPGAASSQTAATSLATQLTHASSQLQAAEGLSVPSAMDQAQADLLRALKLRVDAIRMMASNVETAGGNGVAARAAVDQIALGAAYFYASDILYKGYAAKEIAAALSADGIPVGGTGVTINPGQSLPNLSWLEPSFVATEIGAKVSVGGAGGGGSACGTPPCGHVLNSVSVAGNQLSQNATNTLPASPAPTFTLSVTNAGKQAESNVVCKVSIQGLSDTGTATIPSTAPGQTTTCSVTLPKPPTPGTYQVTAEVKPVPGETNTANNFLTFPISFQ